MKLITEDELAADWGMEPAKLRRMRQERGWPCVRLGRFDVRFTEAQVEQIVAMHTTAPAKTSTKAPTKAPGQTARSASRRRAS